MKPTDPPPPGSPDHPRRGDRGPLPHGARPERDPRRPQDGYDDGVARHASGVHDEFENPDVAHEHSDVNVRAVMTSAGIIAAVVIIAMAGMYGLFGWFEHRAVVAQPYVSPLAPPPVEMPPVAPPFFSEAAGGVPLLVDEPAVLQRHRATERERLETYGWVDEAAGVAHIPIEDAMRLIVERGLPHREFDPVDPTLGTRRPAMGGSSSGRVITGTVPELDVDDDVQPPADPPAPDDQPAPPPSDDHP